MTGLPWAGWLLCRAADPTDGSPMLLLVLLLVLLLLLRGTYLLPPRRTDSPLLLVRRDTLCHCRHQATASQLLSVETILLVQ
ncbi:hypothetical protein BC831DRAFT_441503, partial [Entophlyctis helioformis]